MAGATRPGPGSPTWYGYFDAEVDPGRVVKYSTASPTTARATPMTIQRPAVELSAGPFGRPLVLVLKMVLLSHRSFFVSPHLFQRTASEQDEAERHRGPCYPPRDERRAPS